MSPSQVETYYYSAAATRYLLDAGMSPGFVCMLVEALAGASYDEMCADYMKTYENYYGITLSGTPDRYAAVAKLYFDGFAEFLLDTTNGDEIVSGNYKQAATNYLLDAGMTLDEIVQLTALISK